MEISFKLRSYLTITDKNDVAHLAALQDCVDQVVGILPCAPVFGVDEEDEVAEAEIAEQHPDSFHRFPENRKNMQVIFGDE